MKDRLKILFILISSIHSLLAVTDESVGLYLEHSPFLAVAHLTCIPSSTDEKKDRDQIKDECCIAVVDKISHLCFEEVSSSCVNSTTDMNINALCAASLSTMHWSLQETKESNLASLNSMCHRLLTHIPITNDDKMLFYMNLSMIYEKMEHSYAVTHAETLLQKYVSRNGKIDWKTTISPFSITTTPKNETCKMVALLHSDISSSGGMLRKFPQTIRIRGNISHYKQSTLSNSKLNGKIFLHLPISEGTFLDLDDPFQVDLQETCSLLQSDDSESLLKDATITCYVSVISPSITSTHSNPVDTGIIDIEQPAFVSPQHVVLIQLDFQIEFGSISEDSKGLIDLYLRFVPLLHIRYPMPIDRKTNEEKISLFVPTPYFYEAELDLSTDGKHDETGKIMIPICFDNSHNKDSYGVDRSLTSFHPIYIQVASGYDIHHDYVAIITTLVSLFGAWKLLNSMSRISHWI